MENITIYLLIFVFLCIINKLFHNSYFQEINPIGSHKIWTYSEDESNQSYFETLLLNQLKMNINGIMNDLIILTPETIPNYLNDFPVNMLDESIPYQKRINLLNSFILEKYGGLCISPGTFPIEIKEILNKLYFHELVTIGSNPNHSQLVDNHDFPNTNIIGAKKETKLIKEYKKKLLQNINNNQLISYDILSSLIQDFKPTQYHFGSLSDGTMDIFKKSTNLDDFINSNGPQLDMEKLKAISLPYEELFKNTKYKWFLNLSKEQFEESKFFIQRFL